jgi:hypothetical protein
LPKSPKTAPEIYAALQAADSSARSKWEEKDRLIMKLARIGKMGRKSEIVVRISPTRGVRIRDFSKKFRKEGKLFAKAFARRYDYDEVALEEAAQP